MRRELGFAQFVLLLVAQQFLRGDGCASDPPAMTCNGSHQEIRPGEYAIVELDCTGIFRGEVRSLEFTSQSEVLVDPIVAVYDHPTENGTKYWLLVHARENTNTSGTFVLGYDVQFYNPDAFGCPDRVCRASGALTFDISLQPSIPSARDLVSLALHEGKVKVTSHVKDKLPFSWLGSGFVGDTRAQFRDPATSEINYPNETQLREFVDQVSPEGKVYGIVTVDDSDGKARVSYEEARYEKLSAVVLSNPPSRDENGTATVTVPVNTEVRLTAQVSGGFADYTIEWLDANGASLGLTSPELTVVATADLLIKVKVTDAAGSVAYGSLTVRTGSATNHTLTVHVAGPGSVTSLPEGINCVSVEATITCTRSFAPGTLVRLSGSAMNPGNIIISGACLASTTEEGVATAKLNSDVDCTFTFPPPTTTAELSCASNPQAVAVQSPTDLNVIVTGFVPTLYHWNLVDGYTRYVPSPMIETDVSYLNGVMFPPEAAGSVRHPSVTASDGNGHSARGQCTITIN